MILVVEDAEDAREVSTHLAHEQGWRTRSTGSARECLELAASLLPAAILLDFGLPDMDGWEVTRRLKAGPATRSIPIIALTGHVTGEARDRALRAGVSGYLVKPCLPQDLVEELRRHVEPA